MFLFVYVSFHLNVYFVFYTYLGSSMMYIYIIEFII